MEKEVTQLLQSVQGIAPEMFEQVIRWGIISNLIGAISTAIVIVATWIVFRVVWRKTEDGEARVIALIIAVGVSLVAVSGTAIAFVAMLQAWLTPYAYFVQKLSN